MEWCRKWLGWGGEGDLCAAFAAEVQEREFGRRVRIPVAGRAMQAAALRAAGGDASIGRRTDAPRDGDAVLMLQAGTRREYHVGIYAAGPEPHVLHHVDGAGAMLQPLHDIAAMGFTLEGFYEWA